MVSDSDQTKRQEKRDSLFLSAAIRLADGQEFTTRVRNLSAGGMMIDAADELVPGTTLTAEMRGLGVVKGRIAWFSPGRAGVAFDRDIDPRSARNSSKGASAPVPEYLRPYTHEPRRLAIASSTRALP
jgi:hypothetical protein